MAATCPRCLTTHATGTQYCGVCGAELPATAGESYPDPLVGQIVSDRYRIVSMVGRGGMGSVYRAEHVHIGKPVALKILHGTLGQRKDVLQRFRREAEASSKLNHIHTVQVFDYGHWRGLTYLVMEYLRGQDLASVIRREGRLPWPRAISIIIQICDSLAEAHSLGIVHRDLKPENVLLVPRAGHPDFVKVVDFGLAKIRDDHHQLDVTGDGSLLGTPFYMAPEQIRGEAVDGRTDIYAIGGVLYRALTGVPPFEAATPFAVLTKHLSDAVVPPSLRLPDAQVPEVLDRVVLRAMAKDPNERFRTAEEMRQALLDAAQSLAPPPAGTPASLPAAGASPAPGAPAPFTFATLPSVAAAVAPVSARTDGLDLSRDEFDRYLRRLRVRRWFGLTFLALLVAGGIAAALVVPRLLQESPGARTSEAEPNNVPTQATRIALDTAVSGTLGRRLSEGESDADFYRIEIHPLRKGVLRAEVSGIPGLDLRLDVFDGSGGEPLATGDGGGPGEGEAIAGLLVDGMVYILAVREHVSEGGVPSERISDTYRLTATLRSAEAYEGEPNGDPATAGALVLGSSVSGYLEVAADRDVFCLAGPSPAESELRVRPPAGLDLALEAAGALVNAAGPGGLERLALSPRQPCATVRLAPDAAPEGRAGLGPYEAYQAELAPAGTPLPPAAAAPAGPADGAGP